MSKAYMGSSWNVDDNQQPGVRFWKHLECILEKWGRNMPYRCILHICENRNCNQVKFLVRLILGTSWTNMEAQE